MASACLLSPTSALGNANILGSDPPFSSSLLNFQLSPRLCPSSSPRLRRHAFPPLEQVPRFAVLAAQKQNTPLPETKVDVKPSDKEPLRVFGNSPAGKFFRPERERRPETGDRSVLGVMRFDGVGPETVNSRLAMVGIIWALVAEVVTGQSMVQQVTEGSGLIWFLLVAPVFIWATFVPIFGKGESPDSRKAGPFNARAERWNGRAAMIGIVALLFTEQFLTRGALLGFLHH